MSETWRNWFANPSSFVERTRVMTGSLRKRVLATGTALALICVFGAAIASAAAPMKTGLKVFVIPKNLGNSYFTTADSAKSGGAIAALNALKESGTETSGTAATPASQIPAIQAAITKGANVLLVSATDASALCPTLNSAMQKGITVVTYDSDAPAVPQPVHQPGDRAGDRRERGRPAREADRRLGPDRDRLGRCFRDEPERVDRLHEAGAQEVPEDAARLDGVRQRRSDHLDAGHRGAAPAVPEPEGDHLADHGRDRRSGGSPRHARSTAARCS